MASAIHTASIADFQRNVNTVYATAERVLDIPGYMPGVNLVSSAMRAGLALTQLVHGLAIFVFASFRHLISVGFNRPNPTPQFLTQDAFFLFKNGGLNLYRAVVESTGLPGAVACLIYDSIKARRDLASLSAHFGRNVNNHEIHRPLIAQILV